MPGFAATIASRRSRKASSARKSLDPPTRITGGIFFSAICAMTAVSGLGMGETLENKRERKSRSLEETAEQRDYERSPFSCSSWQSMQYGVQGTAARRLSPMVAPQFVQVPYVPASRRVKDSSIKTMRLRSPSDSERFSSFE